MHNWEHYGRLPAYLLAATLLASCGGGSNEVLSLPGESSVQVVLPESATSVSLNGQTTVAVAVKDSEGNLMPGKSLQLSSSNGLISLPSSVTTDSAGVATFLIKGNGTQGSGVITAHYTDGAGLVKDDTVNYNVVDGSLVASSYGLAGTLSRTVLTTSGEDATATATFTLKDPAGNPVKNQLVTFSLPASSVNRGELSADSAMTDANGMVSVQIQGLNQTPGTNFITATYVDPGDSTAKTSLTFDIVKGNLVALAASETQLTSGGDAVDLTALVTAPSGAVVANVPVTFSVVEKSDTGLVLKNADLLTNSLGQAKVTLESLAKADASNHDIHVKATIGSGKDQREDIITLNIVGTDIVLSTLDNNVKVGDQPTINAELKNGRNVVLVGKSVTFSSSNFTDLLTGQNLNRTVTTDSLGKVTLNNIKVKSSTSGKAVITASGAGATSTISLDVSSVNFTITKPVNSTPLAEADILGQADVEVTLTDEDNPIGVRQVSLSTTLGTISPSTFSMTDSDSGDGINKGVVTAKLTSKFPGQAVINAVATDASGNKSLLATRSVLMVSKIPAKLNLQSVETTLKPLGQTRLVAKVRDANDNPVKGAEVLFNVTNPLGGLLSTSIAITDANGEANTTFTAGTSDTGTDKIQITASAKDFGTVTPSSVNLTVGGEAVFLSIATGNTLQELDATTYAVPYQVTVTDATGAPVANAEITLSVIPVQYYKGVYNFDQVSKLWRPVYSATCSNEDANQNGILDGLENDKAGNAMNILDYPLTNESTFNVEDNGDGKLWPGNPVTLSESKVRTNRNGIVSFNVLYGQSYGNWLRVRLFAKALVSGSESQTDRVFVLPVEASDLADEKVTPPGGTLSPYGISNACSVIF